MATNTAQLVRITATYPWFGDGEPWIWMTSVLEKAKSHNQIVDFEVNSARPPLSITDELMNINFSVIMTDFIIEDAEAYVEAFKLVLNEIVGDTDVELHTIQSHE